MKQKTKILAMLVFITMLLASCGTGTVNPVTTEEEGTATEEKSDEENAAEPKDVESVEEGTIRLWHIHTAETRKNPIEEGLKRFENANPGVKVEVEILENDPYKTKLKTVMGSGDAPDIFHSWGGGWLKSFVDEGLVMDISESIKAWEDNLNPAAIEMTTFDEKIWGSPLFGSSTILYYNKAIFEQYSLAPPETFEELMTICETLKSNNIIPFALGNKSKWPGAQHFVLLSMRMGGADIFQKALDGEVSFTDPVFVKAGEMIQDMVDKGYFPEGSNGINYDTGGSRMMFYTGQAAMIVQTSGFISSCKSEDEDFYNEKLGIALYPVVDDGSGKSTDILSGTNSFSISSGVTLQDSAVKLLEFLSTDQQLQEEIAAGGSLPARIDVDMSALPILESAAKQLQEATYLQNFIDQTLSPELSEMHKDTCQGLFGKTLTPQEAADEMQKLYDSMS